MKTLFISLFISIFFFSCNTDKKSVEIILSADNSDVSEEMLTKMANVLQKRLDLANLNSHALVMSKTGKIRITTSTSNAEITNSLVQQKGYFEMTECAPNSLIQESLNQLDYELNKELTNLGTDSFLIILNNRLSGSDIPFSILLNRFPKGIDWNNSPYFGVIYESDSAFFPFIYNSLKQTLPDWIKIGLEYKSLLKGYYLYAINQNATVFKVNDYFKTAVQEYDSRNKPFLTVSFDAAGTVRLKKMTTLNQGKPLLFIMDDMILAGPIVKKPIENGQFQLTGDFSEADIQSLSIILRSGALPINMQVNSFSNK